MVFTFNDLLREVAIISRKQTMLLSMTFSMRQPLMMRLRFSFCSRATNFRLERRASLPLSMKYFGYMIFWLYLRPQFDFDCAVISIFHSLFRFRGAFLSRGHYRLYFVSMIVSSYGILTLRDCDNYYNINSRISCLLFGLAFTNVFAYIFGTARGRRWRDSFMTT